MTEFNQAIIEPHAIEEEPDPPPPALSSTYYLVAYWVASVIALVELIQKSPNEISLIIGFAVYIVANVEDEDSFVATWVSN